MCRVYPNRTCVDYAINDNAFPKAHLVQKKKRTLGVYSPAIIGKVNYGSQR
jgi:hypothetical protein